MLYGKLRYFFKNKINNGFLLVVIKTEINQAIQFSIGKEYNDEITFVKSFSEKVEKSIALSNPDKMDDLLKEITESDIWKKV